jgi:hypothetical protein
MAELPRILQGAREGGCPEPQLEELKVLLLKAVENHVACVTKPPPNRGNNNFDIVLKEGAQLHKQPMWTERNQDALKVRIEWETDLLASGRAVLMDASEVDMVSNVTTPFSGGKFRPCGAYNAVNDATLPKVRILPSMQDELRDLKANVGALWVSDISKGFFSLWATERAQRLMAVWSATERGKVVVPRVMMFGPKNAPAYFDVVMDEALAGLDLKRVVDDVHGEGVYPPSVVSAEERNKLAWVDGVNKFKQFVERCEQHQLPISLKKTQFGNEVKLLGGIRTKEGFKPDPRRVQALKDLPEPTSRKELLSVMFLLRFFANHSPNLQIELGPLNELTSSKTPFRWGKAEKECWAKALEAVQKQVLLEPFVWSRKTVLISDASNLGRGFWLLQVDDEECLHIIMLKSRAWKKGQFGWSTIRKECTALIEALQDSEHYVRFCEFTLLTDHRPLLWLLRQVQLNPTMWGGAALRAVIYLSQFSCKLRFISGLANAVADLLSRYPFRRDVEDSGSKAAPAWFTHALRSAGVPEDASVSVNTVVKDNNKSAVSSSAILEGKEKEGAKSKSKGRSGIKSLEERRALMDLVAKEPPVHVLELSKQLGLFQADPDCPQDVFVLLADARLKKLPISEDLKTRFEDILAEVDQELPNLHFEHGRLMWKDVFYIPLEAREAICWAAHKAPTAGHFKLDASLANALQVGWWPYMKEHLADFISLCGLCYRIDSDAHSSTPSGVANHVRPAFHTMELDFQEAPFESNGFRYRLTGIDTATRFVVLMHTKTRSAEECLSVIYYELACKYAWPRVFRSDRDKAFAADLNKLWWNFLGIKMELTPPYHPQGVAFVDASHKWQNRIMRSLLTDDQSNWFEMGPVVQKALNSLVRRNTLFSPEQLLFGFRGMSLVEAVVPHFDVAEISRVSLPEKLRMHSKVREVVAELEGRSRGVFISGGGEVRRGEGAKRLLPKTRVGVIFRANPKGTIKKWRVQKKGPYEVVEYLNDATVRVRHIESGTEMERAIDDIRPWVNVDEADHSWEVDAVLDEQLKPEHRFLVRFRGFVKPEWVTAENIHCWPKVDQFRASRPDLHASKVLVARVLDTKMRGKTTLYKVLESGVDLDLTDARWISRSEFRNPEIIDLRSAEE